MPVKEHSFDELMPFGAPDPELFNDEEEIENEKEIYTYKAQKQPAYA